MSNGFINTSVTGGALSYTTDGLGSYTFPLATIVGGGTTGFVQGITQSGLKVELQASEGINPALVFRYLKSKWTKVEIEKLQQRAKMLQKFVKDTQDLGQQAAHEELVKMLLGIVGVMELQACGFDQYIQEDMVKKFEYKVKDRVLKYGKFENFPRAIPDKIAARIKEIQKKGMFDEYWILYLDYAKEELKTNKDRIREKDPILFGKVKSNPDKLFYLIDWVDEYCDLTLQKFVDQVKVKNPDFAMSTLPELDENYLAELKKDFEARRDRLSNTAPSNFRGLMTQEDEANKKKKEEPKGFLNTLRRFFKWQK